jgi:DNA-binding NarL/FixJ family response regulator
MTEKCSVAIVEDDHRIRETVRQLIDRDAEFRCSGAYWTAEQGLDALAKSPTDLLLLDIHLPGMLGTDAVRLFQQRYPNLRVIMFTVFDDDSRIFESLCNGASGYVLKKTPPAKLLEALRDARNGGAPMSSEIARRVVDLFRTFRPRDTASETLTATEVRLLALLADGHSYQKAADAMSISINTVRDHVRSVYEKLQVHSKSAAVSKALRAGII